MENTAYLQSIGVADLETEQKCLAAMEKYGDNHWWEPDTDPRKYAYYQQHERLWLSPTKGMRHFHESLELLVGRQVLPWELVEDAFTQEVERAWTYQVGCTTDAERNERVLQAVQRANAKFGVEVIDMR